MKAFNTKKEENYDFRKRLLQVHKKDIRIADKDIEPDYLMLNDTVKIYVSAKAGEVTKTAVSDFTDYLKVSMNISGYPVSDIEPSDIVIHPVSNDNKAILKDADRYKGFAIITNERINIYGHDERGIAQALYYIEDMMSFEKAPCIKKEEIRRYAMFYPQMIHSGYGLDEYPDEYLARVAHEGRDAILVFTKDVNQTPSGYLDFNDLIKRASRYGIDVYAYSYLKSEKNPKEPDAPQYYENTYGRLFRECPGLKGVTLVGESVEFPSDDPHVFKGKRTENSDHGIPTGKPTAGWYPCYDYPDWLNLIKNVIRKYNKDADIVFWSYNWGSKPEEARIKLIESLPTDISLQATFEMFEHKYYGKTHARCADYTLSFEGPGKYFESEAKAAKKRGIRLYSMTNTGGLTWDIGVIPYEPMPYQWIRRYEKMLSARDSWGLCGIMETHHYGFTPSFISKLSKWAFMEPDADLTAIAQKVIKGVFGKENFEKTNKALMLWSEAIRHYTPTNPDQYGAFRIGPSYPFCLNRIVNIPSSPDAMFGNCICSPAYYYFADSSETALCLRLPEEIKSLEKMHSLLNDGIALLEEISDKNDEILELINLGKFISNSTLTGIHAKKWYSLICTLNVCDTADKMRTTLDLMENLLNAEKENALSTIKLVEYDSRLGWEPSMLYMTDKWHIEWKTRQIDFVLKNELQHHRDSVDA